MSTESQSLITVEVDGRPLGIWDSRAGGDTSAEIGKRRPGGGGTKLYGGRSTVADVTVARGYERERDHDLSKHLETRVGRAQVTVTEQPLDDDEVPWGKPRVWTGMLAGVNTGDADSESDDPRIIELTITAREVK